MGRKGIAIIICITLVSIAFIVYQNILDDRLHKEEKDCINQHDVISNSIHTDERLNDQQYNTLADVFYSKKEESCLYYMESSFVWANGSSAGEGYSLRNASKNHKTIVSWECRYEKDGSCDTKKKNFQSIVDSYK